MRLHTRLRAFENFTEVCVSVQVKEGNEAAHKAKKGVRQAVIHSAKVSRSS